jgi:hypothetical protein
MVTVTYELDYLFLQLYGPHVHHALTWRIVFKLWLRYFLLRSSNICSCWPRMSLILPSPKPCSFCYRRYWIFLFVMNENKQEAMSVAPFELFKSEINNDTILWRDESSKYFVACDWCGPHCSHRSKFYSATDGCFYIGLKLMSLRDTKLEKKYTYAHTTMFRIHFAATELLSTILNYLNETPVSWVLFGK